VMEGSVRVDVHRAVFLLTALSPTRTLFQAYANTNPHIPIVPSWLINWFVKQLAFYIFILLGNQAKTVQVPGSVLNERLNSDPVYSEIRDILGKYFTRLSHPDHDVD